MKPHPLAEQSLDFAVEVVRLCDSIERHAVLKNQLLRSATSIGANIHEGVYAASGADFIAKDTKFLSRNAMKRNTGYRYFFGQRLHQRR